jgi:hypothetical protein
MFSLLAEHARKGLKVEYFGQSKYDFQKSRVTGPWDQKVSVSTKKSTNKFHACVPLKVPKREIFLTELIILSYPIWTGDLGTKVKNQFV